LRRFRLLKLLMITALLLLALASSNTAAASGTWTESKMQYGGYEREYAVYVPSNWVRGGPVFVFFHGFTLGYKDYRKGTGIIEAADKYATALIMPNALPTNLKRAPWLLNPRVWDMGQVTDRNEFIDDALFVDQLIKDVSAQIGADSSRIFLAGHSNGAFFAHHMVGKFPGRFAGLTSIMGRYYKATVPKSIYPLPTVIINGLQDPILPIEGTTGTKPQQNVPAAQENIELWASLMGLEAEPVKSDIKEGGYQLVYKDALGRSMLIAVYVDKQGHWIPGAKLAAFQSFFGGAINMSYGAFDRAWGLLLGSGPQGLSL